MTYESLAWDQVDIGQQLPPLTYELSLLRLVAFVRASGLYDYVHFDQAYAQSVGARDVFASTPHVAGLLSRLLTDWAGPEAQLRSLLFSMTAQSCRDDILAVTGRVERKYRGEAGEPLVDVALNIAHQHSATAVTGLATLLLPSPGQTFAARVPPSLDAQAGQINPEAPTFARELLFKPRPSARKSSPITAEEIHLLCECLEDWNPLYWDREYARGTAYGDIICPSVATFFGVGSSAASGVGYGKPGEKIPEAVKRGLHGQALLQQLRQEMMAVNSPLTLPDYPEVAVVSSRIDCYEPVRPGDSLFYTQQLTDCSAKRRTRLGEGYFFTRQESIRNQRQQLVKTDTKVVLHYRSQAQGN
jgi:acyl dehydratase